MSISAKSKERKSNLRGGMKQKKKMRFYNNVAMVQTLTVKEIYRKITIT